MLVWWSKEVAAEQGEFISLQSPYVNSILLNRDILVFFLSKVRWNPIIFSNQFILLYFEQLCEGLIYFSVIEVLCDIMLDRDIIELIFIKVSG